MILSQQLPQESEPVESLSEGGGLLPLSEGISQGDFSPMTKLSTLVDTDYFNAKLIVHPEENSPAHVTPAAMTPSRLEPCWHPNTNPKVKDWHLYVIKPILLIGDSNLSRIPPFRDDNIQVDSFPGAKLYHLLKILKKLQPHNEVREVVLLVGLNNCLERVLPKTVEKQLSLLTSLAKQLFPHANVRYPLIHFSTLLEDNQKQHREFQQIHQIQV